MFGGSSSSNKPPRRRKRVHNAFLAAFFGLVRHAAGAAADVYEAVEVETNAASSTVWVHRLANGGENQGHIEIAAGEIIRKITVFTTNDNADPASIAILPYEYTDCTQIAPGVAMTPDIPNGLQYDFEGSSFGDYIEFDFITGLGHGIAIKRASRYRFCVLPADIREDLRPAKLILQSDALFHVVGLESTDFAPIAEREYRCFASGAREETTCTIALRNFLQTSTSGTSNFYLTWAPTGKCGLEAAPADSNIGDGLSSNLVQYVAAGSDRVYRFGNSLTTEAQSVDICLCPAYDMDHVMDYCQHYEDYIQHIGVLHIHG